jgi:hypothetical protein
VFNYYINGALASTATATWDALAYTDSGNLVMGTLQFQTDPSQTSGATSQAWASHLTGGLDEIRIFNKALSAAEVLALYEEVN